MKRHSKYIFRYTKILGKEFCLWLLEKLLVLDNLPEALLNEFFFKNLTKMKEMKKFPCWFKEIKENSFLK